MRLLQIWEFLFLLVVVSVFAGASVVVVAVRVAVVGRGERSREPTHLRRTRTSRRNLKRKTENLP